MLPTILLTVTSFLMDVSTSPVYNMQPAYITANIGTAGRNIRNLPCISRKTKQSGVCMFAIDCLKANGTHLGTCIDRFYFGSCCHIEPVQDIIDNTIDTSIFPGREPPNRVSTTKKTTTTTKPEVIQKLTTITTEKPTTSTRVEASTRPPIVLTKEPAFLETTEISYKLTTFQSVDGNVNDFLTTLKPFTISSFKPNFNTQKPSVNQSDSGSIINENSSNFLLPERFSTSVTTKPIAARQNSTESLIVSSKPTYTSPKPSSAKTTSRPVLNQHPMTASQSLSKPSTVKPPSLFKPSTLRPILRPSQQTTRRPTYTIKPITRPVQSYSKPTLKPSQKPNRTKPATTTKPSKITKLPSKPILTTKIPTKPLRQPTKPPFKITTRRPAVTTKIPGVSRKPVNKTTTYKATPAATTSPSTKYETTPTTQLLGTTHKITVIENTSKVPFIDTVTRVPITKTTMKSPEVVLKITTKTPDTTQRLPETTPLLPESTANISELTSKIPDTVSKSPESTSSKGTIIEATTKIHIVVDTTNQPSATTSKRTTPSIATTPKTESTAKSTSAATEIISTTASPQATSQSSIVLTSQATESSFILLTVKPATDLATRAPGNDTMSHPNDIPSNLNASDVLQAVNGNVATNEIESGKPVVTETSTRPNLITWTMPSDEHPTNIINSTNEEWVPMTTPDGWVLLPIVTTSPEPLVSQLTTMAPIVSSTQETNQSSSEKTTEKIMEKTTESTSTVTQETSTQDSNYTGTSTELSDTSSIMTQTGGPTTELLLDKPVNMSDFTDVCGRRMYPESRIVGGEKSAYGKWPWQISLRQWRTSTYLHKCGAALLNENWAITAAHCVDNVPPSDLLLRLGEHDLSTEAEPYLHQERRVQIVASHPQFDPRTFEYDLALLRFYEPVKFQPNIIPVCVPQTDENFVGRTAHVTGWGRLYEDGPLPSVLQEVSVPVINNTLCESMYRMAGYIEHIPHIFICAGWRRGGFDSCEGDSGGPMVIQRPDKRFLLAGVISWGIGCAEPNQPGVYTRISEFRDWINQILQF